MSQEAIGYIDNLLTKANVNYEFGEWTGDSIYPYVVGEYQEMTPLNEDGMIESLFILNAFTRGSWLELEQVKAAIEKAVNVTDILSNGNGIAVMYSNSLIIPTGEENLKRIQINLNIKEWRI